MAPTRSSAEQQQRNSSSREWPTLARIAPIAVVAHPIRSCILLAACWRTSPAANASKVFIPKV
jgi:hypothetical protein